MEQKVIGFLSNQLTLRGTEIAMYDYADFNETILGNKSIIITRDYNIVRHGRDASLETYIKFKKRFPLEYYNSQKDIDNIVEKNNITHLYIIKGGTFDGLISTKCINLIHCVFNTSQPHGQIYSAISNDVNRLFNTNYPVVPHMIRNFQTDQDLRKDLNIPSNAIVFGRYGGLETFDINFVHQAIIDTVKTRSDIYFIFMNTYKFADHSQIIYLNGTTSMEYKRKFINTSDAMIHARKDGESFGIACGEFATQLKPVITWNGSIERNHINILGHQAVLYSDYDSVYKIINEFEKNKYSMEGNGYLEYNPENIMRIFNQIYLSTNIVIPIGFDCGMATLLKKYKMRHFAYPFDWNLTYQGVANIIGDNFDNFFKFDSTGFNSLYGIKLIHDTLPTDYEKITRRINRFKNLLKTYNDKIIFVRKGHAPHNHKECDKFCNEISDAENLDKILSEKYPNLKYSIVIFLICKTCYFNKTVQSNSPNIVLHNILMDNVDDNIVERKFLESYSNFI